MLDLRRRCDGSDLKRCAVNVQRRTWPWIGLKCQSLRSNHGRPGSREFASRTGPPCEKHGHAVLAVFRKHQYQTKKDQKQERDRFKVVTAVKKMIPGPYTLGERHGGERCRGQNQKRAPDPHEHSGRRMYLARFGIVIHSSSAQLDKKWLWDVRMRVQRYYVAFDLTRASATGTCSLDGFWYESSMHSPINFMSWRFR